MDLSDQEFFSSGFCLFFLRLYRTVVSIHYSVPITQADNIAEILTFKTWR